MASIIELAEQLGKAIADSPQAAALQKARKAMDDDPNLAKAMQEYQQQAEKMARLEQENKPIEVEDKQKLQRIQGVLVASAAFKKFSAAQVEYVDLMRKVNQAIQQQLGEAEGDE